MTLTDWIGGGWPTVGGRSGPHWPLLLVGGWLLPCAAACSRALNYCAFESAASGPPPRPRVGAKYREWPHRAPFSGISQGARGQWGVIFLDRLTKAATQAPSEKQRRRGELGPSPFSNHGRFRGCSFVPFGVLGSTRRWRRGWKRVGGLGSGFFSEAPALHLQCNLRSVLQSHLLIGRHHLVQRPVI